MPLDIGIIKFNDNGPRLITKRRSARSHKFGPRTFAKEETLRMRPRQRISPQREQTTSARPHTLRFP